MKETDKNASSENSHLDNAEEIRNYFEGLAIDSKTLPVISKLTELIPGGFFIYKAFGDQQLISFNSRMLTIFGCKTDEEFREHVGNSFKGIVHPDDYEEAEKSIREQISKRLDKLDHVIYRIIRKDGSIGVIDDYGHYNHTEEFGEVYFVFIQDITEQHNEEIEIKRLEDQRRQSLISKVAGSESTYIGYPETDHFIILGQNDHLKKHYPPDETFTTSITRYIQHDVFDADREAAAKAMTLANFVKQLETQTEYTFRYRDISSGNARWYELRALWLSDTEILYSFTDKDDEIIEHLMYKQMNDNYFGLYYVTLDNGLAKIIHSAHTDLTGEVGSVVPYVDLIKNIASESKGETVDFLHRISDVEYIKERFMDEDVAYYVYKSYIFEGDRWISVNGRVLSRTTDGTPQVYVLGFSLMDERASKREENLRLERENMLIKKRMEETDSLINNMCSAFDIVYLINMADDSVEIRKIGPDMLEVGHNFEKFTDARDFFIDNIVHPRDRERMRRQLSYDEIRNRLKDTTSYSMECTILKSGATIWTEATVTSIDNDKIVISVAQHDLEIGKRHLEEKRYDEYMALYVVDIDTKTIRPIKTSPLYGTLKEGETADYSTIIKHFSEIQKGEVKEFFLWLSDLENVKKDLAEDDKRTFSYKPNYIIVDKWIDITTYVIQRNEDGSPGLFTLGFSLVDALATSRKDMLERVNENLQMIGGLAGEYYALYYYSFEPEEFKIYSLDETRFPQAAKMVMDGGEPFDILMRFGTSPLVHPDDRRRFSNLTRESLQENLSHSKKFTIRFRRNFNGQYLWTDLDFIKYGDYDEPATVIAIGFAERDDAIRSEMVVTSCFEIIDMGLQPDDAVNRLLENVGDYYGAERAYIFEYDSSGNLISNTYEWCAEGVEAMIDKLQNVPADAIEGWIKEFKRRGAFFMDALDDENNTPEGRELLEMQGIDALIAAPIVSGDGIVGFIGVDNPTRAKTHSKVLQSIATVTHSEILKRKENDEEHITLKKLTDTFLSVYYVDFSRDYMHNWKIDEFGKESFGGVMKYSEAMHNYVNQYVAENDRGRCIEMTKAEYVLEKFKTCDRFSIGMTDIMKGENKDYLFDFVKVSNDGNQCVISCTDVTESLAKEREQQQRLTEQNVITAFFLEPFVSAYYVGLEDMTCRILRRTEQLEAEYPIVTDFIDSLEEYISKEVHPEDQQALRNVVAPEYMHNKLAQQKEYSHTFRCYVEGEERIYKLAVIRGADEAHAAFGFTDITEEVHQEREQQRQMAEALAMAESANRAKTTFLNNMSHDIRTPMNAIIGFTGLAASHINNKELVQNYLGKINQSSSHLLSLINDVLDMSRIESGKMNIEEAPENLPQIIHTLRDIVQADIHAKQHDFYIDTVNVNDENVICDKLRLNQVLLNILSNSIKYTSQGGTISMRITEKTVKPTGYATYEFRIKDNGVGMDQEYLKRIFEPFTRVKSSTVSGIQGTGLGMAITKSIIDMMGGTIEMWSEVGKGTETVVTFDFKLLDAHKEAAIIPELEGMRALVADDDANTCVSIEKMLKEIGMRSEWCTSGREAVFRAENAYRNGDTFKVYILDWLMPDMNGIETTRRIRKAIGNEVPIIILTAYDWSDIEEEAREAGVTAFVSKPMFPSDLNKVLRDCMGKTETAEEGTEKCDFSGKKVLLVEDNELNREIASAVLEEYGCTVVSAEDGDIAVEMMRAAKEGDYDIVLMDIQMPTMNGHEATRQIRKLPLTDVSKGWIEHLPIIAMTANAFEEDRKAALEAGMNEHIAKPIDLEQLKAMLTRFLK